MGTSTLLLPASADSCVAMYTGDTKLWLLDHSCLPSKERGLREGPPTADGQMEERVARVIKVRDGEDAVASEQKSG